MLFLNTISRHYNHSTIKWVPKNNSLQKPTHTDMYLHWDSYHHLSTKFSVINTLRHRTKTVYSNSQLLKEEEDHPNHALRRCRYPLWALNIVNINQNQKRKNKGTNNNNINNINKPHNVVPYMKGLGESCKTSAGNMEWKCISGKAAPSKIPCYSGVIYRYRSGRVDWEDEYIGESGRTFGKKFREHMRAPSLIIDHHNITGHEVSLDNFSTVGREDNSIAGTIKEAILIRVNGPYLNRNIGKFQLPHIWDEVLAKSPELKLK